MVKWSFINVKICKLHVQCQTVSEKPKPLHIGSYEKKSTKSNGTLSGIVEM